MLPSSDFNLPDIPYRLPSRCQTYGDHNGLNNYNKYLRTSCNQNSISRAYTTFDYYTKRNDESHSDVTKIVCAKSAFSSRLEEFNSKLFQAKAYNGQTVNMINSRCTNAESLSTNSNKLLWIDDLKKWIVKEPSFIEFINLSKKAKVFENEMIRSNIPKTQTQDELEFCERFSKHFMRASNSSRNKRIKTSVMDTRQLTKSNNQKSSSKPILTQSAASNRLHYRSIKLDTFDNSPPIQMLDCRSEESSILPGDRNHDEQIVENEKLDAEDLQITGATNETKPQTEVVKTIVNNGDLLKEENRLYSEKNNVENMSSKENLSDTSLIVNDNSDAIEISTIVRKSFDEKINGDEIINAPLMDSKNLDSENETTKEFKKTDKLQRRQSDHLKVKKMVRHRIMSSSSPSKPEIDKIEISKRKSIEENLDSDESSDSDEPVAGPVNGSDPVEPELLISPEVITHQVDHVIVPSNVEIIRDKMAPLLEKQKRRWGKKQLDLSYAEQLERERLAEVRKLKMRKKLQFAIDKSKQQRKSHIPDGPRFESYGFLAKYCIFTKINVGLYRNTFDVCDEGRKHWLTGDELLMALKGVNPNLKNCDVAHMHLVLKVCNYDLASGADFKLFSVLSALSVQITGLDSWIKSYMGSSDFELMQRKIRYCKNLWECLVDPLTNTMPIDSLCIELKAGGVTQCHIDEVQQRFRDMTELNLIDFLTYIPLFIAIHMSIINNPLDVSERI